MRPRIALKRALSRWPLRGGPEGLALLIYHRVGGGTKNELDLTTSAFAQQLEVLARHDVLPLDHALDRLDDGDRSPSVVLTFDDGFDDIHANAWPLMKERGLPFTIYLSSAYVGGNMVWEGATATGPSGQGLTWDQLSEMVGSGLCTVGNHTHRHVGPGLLTVEELDECSAAIDEHLGFMPRHFTYPWGIPVPHMEPAIRQRFRSASTGTLGRNLPSADRMRLSRIPVRQSDPIEFFEAKLGGSLLPERTYGELVRLAKKLGVSA